MKKSLEQRDSGSNALDAVNGKLLSGLVLYKVGEHIHLLDPALKWYISRFGG